MVDNSTNISLQHESKNKKRNISLQHESKNKKRNIPIAILACFLLIDTIAATIPSTQNHTLSVKSHTLIKSTCASTLYPDLCLSSLVAAPATATSTIATAMDVVYAALDLTISSVQLNKIAIKKMNSRGSFSVREKTALQDCLETIDDSLDELQRVDVEIKNYPSKNYSIDDVITLLSAAMTNQETCIDGFSHDRKDRKVRLGLLDGQLHVFRLCSNVLSMIKNMTNTKTTDFHEQKRRIQEWPNWLPAGDRRLLQATTVTPDVTVAQDGTGNYRTVSEAVAAAPSGSGRRYVIRIRAGIYRENVEVPRGKSNIMFIGDGQVNTFITGNRNVVDGSTTFHSATVAVVADRFLARDITFENTAGPSKHQAVALRVNADFTAFHRCTITAFQDTLYVHSFRQFYVSCIIIGTVDFIFGNAAVVIQNSDIHARTPNPRQRNMVTAQGRDDPNENTGIVIQNCRIGATKDLQGQQGNFPTYLGRPWKRFSRTIVMQSEIGDVIHPAGWFEWSGNYALDTLFYAEYQNRGPGNDTSRRVNWRGYRVLSNGSQVQEFTAGNFIAGGSWLPSTGFPFSLGL